MQAITLEQKNKVLEALQNGNGASSVGRQFGLSESSVSTIKLDEKKIRAAYASPDFAKGKLHLKSALYGEMEDALKLLVEDMQRQKLPLTGLMLQNQAYEIQSRILEKEGKSIKDSKFTASTGWLYKFIKRTGLRNVTLSDKPQTARKELTIPKPREFTSATQFALQHDPDMEHSMQVVEALPHSSVHYPHQMSFYWGSWPIYCTSGQTRPSSSASRMSDASTATPPDSDVDDELVELGSAYSEDDLPN
ncbi:Tigger transposable element-derived protein 1-like 120 [Homarus americanus]|uniref:Tigger transposable element-derived protein 1-like 120 n=1 Tax=Homarus americanus TaxID=6706 RepID=A0A8J5N1W0_HOMAM|nr:Tigger transposable element-derived protein 1-like 120 [Homarus americanus]